MKAWKQHVLKYGFFPSQGLSPYEFVEGMKTKGIRVPGIGHR